MLIEYIGAKPIKTDNVAGTGAVWLGAGDVKEVPAEAAPKLLAYPTIWREAQSRPRAILAQRTAAQIAQDYAAARQATGAGADGNLADPFAEANPDAASVVGLTQAPVRIGPVMAGIETVTYPDGSTATGTAPLPASPATLQQSEGGAAVDTKPPEDDTDGEGDTPDIDVAELKALDPKALTLAQARAIVALPKAAGRPSKRELAVREAADALVAEQAVN